jgi:hypothetical protein
MAADSGKSMIGKEERYHSTGLYVLPTSRTHRSQGKGKDIPAPGRGGP